MRRLSLTAWIFIGMAAGIALGIAAPGFAAQLSPVSNTFLRLIRSIIAPLIFGTLVYGIAGSGDLKRMGRIGLKAIVYFEAVTTVALFLGLAAVNLVRPGAGMTLAANGEAPLAATQQSAGTIIEHVFPSSIIDAMARGDVLEIVVFSFLFGAACAAIGEKAKPVVAFCESLAQVMFRYTSYVMYLAPFGVAAAIAVTVASKGSSVLLGLGKLVLTMYAAQFVFVTFVLGSIVMLFRLPGRCFLPCSARAVPHRLLDRVERGRPAACARKHGAIRRAAAHRGLCDPNRLQLQRRRIDTLLIARIRFRRAGRGHPFVTRPTASHDADVDADNEGSGRCPASGLGLAGRRSLHLSPADGRSRSAIGSRCATRYGAHLGQCPGQLPGIGGRGALGRRNFLRTSTSHGSVMEARCRDLPVNWWLLELPIGGGSAALSRCDPVHRI